MAPLWTQGPYVTLSGILYGAFVAKQVHVDE